YSGRAIPSGATPVVISTMWGPHSRAAASTGQRVEQPERCHLRCPQRPATTTKTAARRSRPPPGRSPAPSHDRVPTTTRIRHGAHRWPTTSTPTNAADPDTKRTDAPAAPIPTAAPTHRPTPHAPHPRAPSRRPTRNPPPPTRHRRSHSASRPPPLILPADRHPPQPDSATTSELRHPRRPVAPPTQRVAP